MKSKKIKIILFGVILISLAMWKSCILSCSNGWCLLTYNNYFIPDESNIFIFDSTKIGGGSGEEWLYGEDNTYYYGLNTKEPYSPRYFKLKKGNEPKDFDKFDYHTWGCDNPDTGKIEFSTNLLEAKVGRITERLQVMIAPYDSFAESLKLITDSVVGATERQIFYDENGKATCIYKSASEGFVQYSSHQRPDMLPSHDTVKGFIVYLLHPNYGYLPFGEEDYKYKCKIDRDKNCIIDTANPKPGRHIIFVPREGKVDFVTDTIKDFVIIPKDKIILSKDDHELLQKAKKDEDKIFGTRYILYRYEEDSLARTAYNYLLKLPIDLLKKIREYTAIAIVCFDWHTLIPSNFLLAETDSKSVSDEESEGNFMLTVELEEDECNDGDKFTLYGYKKGKIMYKNTLTMKDDAIKNKGKYPRFKFVGTPTDLLYSLEHIPEKPITIDGKTIKKYFVFEKRDY